MPEPHGRVAMVTGASRGVGRGVAAELARSGYRVFATGRSVLQADLPSGVHRLTCDHTDDAQVEAAFESVRDEAGRLDVLVSSAWGGYERMVEDGRFTWADPFWLQPTWRWAAMMDAGVRSAFMASRWAVPMMIEGGGGLVVHVSYWAARKYLGNVIYGVAKAATDKMAADMAHDLTEHHVAVVSMYPGLVRTEAVLSAAALDLSNSESPEFVGRAVAALAADPDVMRRTGSVVVVADLARDYGFTDIDGRRPRALTLETA